jgi:hypothetical protein
MAQATKSAYYQALKRAGAPFAKHYRDYTTDELKQLHGELALPPIDEPAPALPTSRPDEAAELRAQLAALTETVGALVQLQTQRQAPGPQQGVRAAAEPQHHTIAERARLEAPPVMPTPSRPTVQAPREAPLIGGLDTKDHAGLTTNTHTGDDVLFVDQHGNKWFQKEVRKPAFPKPRGRRVLRTYDAAVAQETVKVDDRYFETFEVSGDPQNLQATEVKITLPSYQTGIYLAPNMPFKIHTYNGKRGFDLEDVERFYGAADLVPDTIKKTYVSNDLCYDITTTIRAIKDEHRELVLQKGR